MAADKETARGKRGTKIVEDFARDDSSLNVPKPHGRDLGGSATNLDHSIRDCSVAPEK
jgi:hypothetical protein